MAWMSNSNLDDDVIDSCPAVRREERDCHICCVSSEPPDGSPQTSPPRVSDGAQEIHSLMLRFYENLGKPSSNKPPTPSSDTVSSNTERMKRAAADRAKHLIERYYYQLTDGCGQSNCRNVCCKSCDDFEYKTLSPNEAAVQAIALMRSKALLCEHARPPKVAKSSSDTSPSHHAHVVGESSHVSHSPEEEVQQAGASTSRSVALASAINTVFSNSPLTTTSSSSSSASSRPESRSTSPQKASPTKTASTSIKDVMILTEKSLDDICQECEMDNNYAKLIRTIGCVFNNPDSLMGSFLKSGDVVQPDTGIGNEVDEDNTMEEEQNQEKVVAQDLDKDEDESQPSPMAEDETVVEEGSSVDAECVCEEEQQVEEQDAGEGSSSSTISSNNSQAILGNNRVRLKDQDLTVDIYSVRRMWTKLFALPDLPFQGALINAIVYLTRSIERELKYAKAYENNQNYLNIFVILFELGPHLGRQDFLEDATASLCRATGALPFVAQAQLATLWSGYSGDWLHELLRNLHQLITLRFINAECNRSYLFNEDEAVAGAARVMKIIYYSSLLAGEVDSPLLLQREQQTEKEAEANLHDFLEGAVALEGANASKERGTPKEDPLGGILKMSPLSCRKPLLSWEDFVNELLSEHVRMEKDYTYYKAEGEPKFSFMLHSFLLTPAVKNMGMYYDNRIRMMNERRFSILQSIMHGAPSVPYLRLRIRRDHIIDDALVGLEMVAMENPGDLKKQLYVEFEDEQGIDEGGVSKEFFQLVVEEIFNPDIGMFTYDEETRQFWFNPTSFENDGQFTLIGIMLGLAIYNNVILDVHFPMVVYRKLLGKLGTFTDLIDSHPTLGNSLQDLLHFEGDVEETFMQTFLISFTDIFGAVISHSLKEDGHNIQVTNKNRQEYVDLYADYLLNKAISKQFGAFKRGFQMVTDESPLKMLFRPEEVELLVCGSKDFDFHSLEDATEYDGGFTEDSSTIKNFWDVAHNDFDQDQKRKLLQFATGSDRVPVGGLSKLKLVIARNGPDSTRLPTSHTCFNVLLLPDYNNRDKLKERLLKAISYAKGFGML